METRMKNPSCEVFMNDVETKVYVMEKENPGSNPRKCCLYR
jgi:hypothetical protein